MADGEWGWMVVVGTGMVSGGGGGEWWGRGWW